MLPFVSENRRARRFFSLMSGGRNVLFKLKEVWSYMITFFPESEKYGKKIKKAKTVEEYQRIVDTLFREMGIV